MVRTSYYPTRISAPLPRANEIDSPRAKTPTYKPYGVLDGKFTNTGTLTSQVFVRMFYNTYFDNESVGTLKLVDSGPGVQAAATAAGSLSVDAKFFGTLRAANFFAAGTFAPVWLPRLLFRFAPVDSTSEGGLSVVYQLGRTGGPASVVILPSSNISGAGTLSANFAVGPNSKVVHTANFSGEGSTVLQAGPQLSADFSGDLQLSSMFSYSRAIFDLASESEGTASVALGLVLGTVDQSAEGIMSMSVAFKGKVVVAAPFSGTLTLTTDRQPSE